MSALDTTFLNHTTREMFIPALQNQVYSKAVLYAMLNAGGRLKPATGTSLSWRHVARKHIGLGLYDGYDVLAAQPGNPLESASLSPAQYFAPLTISGKEERANTGNKEKLIDMLKVQFDNAKATFTDLMSTHTYAASTSIGGITCINGLGVILSASNTYAGILRTTAGNEYWHANVINAATLATSYTELIDPTDLGYLPKQMRTAFTSASYDGSPTIIVTHVTDFNIYQDIYGIQNYRENKEIADLGFRNVEFQGIPMVWDRYQTSGYMDFLNLERFQFFYYPGANMDLKSPGWVDAQNQDARLAYLIWEGQLRCDVPRENTRMTGIPHS